MDADIDLVLNSMLQEIDALDKAMDAHEGCNLHGWVLVKWLAGNFHFSIHAQNFFSMKQVGPGQLLANFDCQDLFFWVRITWFCPSCLGRSLGSLWFGVKLGSWSCLTGLFGQGLYGIYEQCSGGNIEGLFEGVSSAGGIYTMSSEFKSTCSAVSLNS